MQTKIPVLLETNGSYKIALYQESDDGSFRRTSAEPLRSLHDYIAGIDHASGELVARKFDRDAQHPWESPTVLLNFGHAKSLYQFLREQVAARRLYVFTSPSQSAEMLRLNAHELRLKHTAGGQAAIMMQRKYVEALGLWAPDELARRHSAAPLGAGAAHV